MAYNKTNWQSLPSTDTPISTGNLNKIENGIYDNSLKADQVGDLTELDTTEKSTLVGAINEVNDEVNDLISVSLYNDIDGTAGTVTLNDSAANYSYIEIYFYVIEGGGRTHKSVKVSNPNSSYVLLDMTDFNNNALVFNTNLVYINATEITRIRNRRFTIAESSSWTPYGSVANIVIEKVVGYK